MRDKRYIKKGMVIEVQIRDEYYASANIIQINKEKTEFKCILSIHDIESGFIEELDESFSIVSTSKTVNTDITIELNKMIDNGLFQEHVNNLDNLMNCMNALLEFQKKLRQEN